uniref:Uncharacterized protein n=1 Tax=Arundo donax TaxID=35708 RepID=A0A0A9AHR4_ARUDO
MNIHIYWHIVAKGGFSSMLSMFLLYSTKMLFRINDINSFVSQVQACYCS